MIQPLSFDLADDEHIGAKAAKWAGYANAMNGSAVVQTPPKFVLGLPQSPTLLNTFEAASNHLKKVVGNENVFLEENSELLIDHIADAISHHR